MARMASVRDAYSNDTVVTTPDRLITMLYDRLARDLIGAEASIEQHDRETANGLLMHAQEIVFELFSALDTDLWEGAEQLATLYTWMLRTLAESNLRQDLAGVRHVRSLVEPLGEAWHAAANELASNALGAAV